MSERPIWGITQGPDDSVLKSAQEIQNYLNCHPVIARLLWGRGFHSVQILERFLRPELSQLPDPLSILDMAQAVARTVEAIANEEKIVIYGDYDVDGTCGSSLLLDFFRSIDIEVVSFQPNRFTEGYGVHSAAIEKLIDEGANLIITVDCGITAVEPAKVARARGVDMIVIDHHKVGASLPEAFAVVDPQRPEDTSGLLNVCGTGLAFFFAMALRASLRAEGFFEERAEPNLVRLLDLVAVATVADVVDVRGVNRILISHGLKVMGRSPRIGIKAMLEAANVPNPTAMHCGFVLGPRINAAGRLQSARAAFDLLTSTDVDSARGLAKELEEINLARRQTQEGVVAQAREQAMAQINDPRWKELAEKIPGAALSLWPRALVLCAQDGDETWHEGVVGIVASKIVEEFGRPTFILATKEGADKETGEEVLKGSVRSISKVDILSQISAESVAKHLLNFGGHAHAGGVSLLKSNLQNFREAINEHMAVTTSEEHYRRERRFDAEIEMSELNARLVEELQKLEPFGHNFPEPVFKLVNASALSVRVLKEKHLKLSLGGGIDAIWFNVIREENPLIEVSKLEAGAPCAFWVSPQFNEWQGVRRLQLQIRHGEIL